MRDALSESFDILVSQLHFSESFVGSILNFLCQVYFSGQLIVFLQCHLNSIKKIRCLKFILFSLGSDIGFSMFTLRENLDGFLKEVEVGFVLYFRCVSILDKCCY